MNNIVVKKIIETDTRDGELKKIINIILEIYEREKTGIQAQFFIWFEGPWESSFFEYFKNIYI